MAWAHLCLDEAITPTFWAAMILIAAGVILGQTGAEQPAEQASQN